MSGVKFEEEQSSSGSKCYRLSGGTVKGMFFKAQEIDLN